MKRVELWINNVLVDLIEESIDSLFLITKQIQDIREPDKKQTDFSKTITLPGSDVNDRLFSYAFSLSHDIQSSGTNFTPDFNPNLQAEVVAFLDGAEFFRGVCQLIKVRVTDDVLVMYDIILLGKLANIFTDIGDRELTELDFSEYNHTYNNENVHNSWATSIMVNGSPQAFAYGTGYVYPLIDYGFSSNLQDFPLNNMYPALSAREYLYKIFKALGYTWTSAFLDGAFFKRLYIPFKSALMKLTAAQVAQRKFRASRVSSDQVLSVPITQANSVVSTIIFNDDSTAPNFDTSNQYNTATGQYTVASGLEGTFTFCGQIILTGTFTPNTAGVSVRSQYSIRSLMEMIKIDIGGNATVLQTVLFDIQPNQPFTTTYTTASIGSVNPVDLDYASSPFNPRNYVNIIAPNVSLLVGERVAIRIRRYAIQNQYGINNLASASQLFQNVSTGVFYDGTLELNVKVNSVFYNLIDNAQIVEGQTVLMNNTLPQKVKQKDFVMSIFKMFNLYVEQDESIKNNFLIEPRDTYYNSTVIDLTTKLDKSRELEIRPMGALEVRNYNFKYKPDTDYYNQIYNDGYPLDYGERQVSIENDFVKGTKTNELIFSPTPSVGSTTNDRVIPRIIKISNGVVSSHEGNIRILYYGGLKDTNQVWNITSSGQTYTFGQYPYIGHLDDPYTSSIDLCFYPPAEIYWADYFHSIWYTNNNLYNAYHKNFIEEITDKNSKIVTGWFQLNALDIKNMDFRKLYFFEDEYFRLNKIHDFNPVSDELTKCEFIKIKQAVGFTPSSGNLDLAEPGDETLPATFKPALHNGNTGGGALINGTENRTNETLRAVLINGHGNTIGDYSENITLLSSSGVTILGNSKNMTVMNTQNKKIRNDNTVVIQGQSFAGEDTIIKIGFTGSTILRDGDETAGIHLIDTSSGTVTIQLEEPAKWVGLKRTFKKISNDVNDVVIIPYSGAIDNEINLTWNVYKAAYTISTDGINYYVTEHYG